MQSLFLPHCKGQQLHMDYSCRIDSNRFYVVTPTCGSGAVVGAVVGVVSRFFVFVFDSIISITISANAANAW